jgi:hypothetical protein
MTAQSGSTYVDTPPTRDSARLYQDGIVAGLLGAASVAIWFLFIDWLAGRPFYTPTVLGTALFRGGTGLGSPETLPISLEMVLMFTWVHALVFAVIGGAASLLLGLAERNATFGFGIMMLLVFFQFGFVVASLLFAAPVLKALAWPLIFGANMLATAVMALYFWRRHPRLEMSP